jgi:hypothetical protein
MAYHDLTTRPDVEFLGGNKVRDVIVLSAWTVPHEIYFEARYPGRRLAAVIRQIHGGRLLAHVRVSFYASRRRRCCLDAAGNGDRVSP